MTNLRRKGEQYEKLAALYLRKHGVRILDHNFHDGKRGEIDLIGDDHGTILFIEVKYRAGHNAGYAEEAVTLYKQQTIIRTAQYYLCRKPFYYNRNMRFDVVAIEDTDTEGQVHIRWIRNAFQMQES